MRWDGWWYDMVDDEMRWDGKWWDEMVDDEII